MSEVKNGRRAILGAAMAAGLGVGLASAGLSLPAQAGQTAAGMSASNKNLRVAILLYDGFTALDAVGPYEVMCRIPEISVMTVAKQPGPMRTDTGMMSLVAEYSMAKVRKADVLLIPGAGNRGVIGAMKDTETLDWVRRIHKHTTWTTSVCTGALILGAAGLLKGVPATTYWASRNYLESEFGAIYTPGRFVESGKIITAAGVSAGIDMALHLAAKLTDEQTAKALQLAVEYDPDPPYDTGSPEKAGPELQKLALKLVEDAAQ